MQTTHSTAFATGSRHWEEEEAGGMTMLSSSLDWTSALGRMNHVTHWVKLCALQNEREKNARYVNAENL